MGETFIAAVRFASERETEERNKGSGNDREGAGILPAICNEQVCNLCVHNFAWCRSVCVRVLGVGSLISPIERLCILIRSRTLGPGRPADQLEPYLGLSHNFEKHDERHSTSLGHKTRSNFKIRYEVRPSPLSLPCPLNV